MKFNKLLTRLLMFTCIGVLFNSCGASKRVKNAPSSEKKIKTSVSKSKSLTINEKINRYIATFAPIAQTEMRKYGVPASITLAQGILESEFGEGRLAVQGNNHFGIKCHREWSGKRIYHNDNKKGECFRVYEDPTASYRDHSLFLKNRSRYAFLFDIRKSNYKAWAKGLKKAGYATDPAYPRKLIGLIERFDLDRFDSKHRKSITKLDDKLNRSNLHLVQKGDTVYSISKKYNVAVEKIIQKNNLDGTTIYLGQLIIIPK